MTPLTAALNNPTFNQAISAHQDNHIRVENNPKQHILSSQQSDSASVRESIAGSHFVKDDRSNFSGVKHQLHATQNQFSEQNQPENKIGWAAQKRLRRTEVRPKRAFKSSHKINGEEVMMSENMQLKSYYSGM